MAEHDTTKKPPSSRRVASSADAPSQATDVPAKRRRSRELTEEALYTTATSLFYDNGYAATSLEQIARRIGVHKSTIFHYVPSKAALLAKILDAAFHDYVASIGSIARRRGKASVRLQAALENHLQFVLTHTAELQIYLRERQHLSDPEGRAYVQITEQYQAIFTRLVRDAMREGSVPSGDPTVACLLLLGCANSIAEWFRPDGPVPAGAIAEQCINLLLGQAVSFNGATGTADI